MSLYNYYKCIISNTQKQRILKIYDKSITINSSFVGFRTKVYNGKDFVNFVVSSEMVGFRFGNFVFTRSRFEFKKKKKKK